jgi:hypothetical protein
MDKKYIFVVQRAKKHLTKTLQNMDIESNSTRVTHIINYELPTTGKIANVLTGSQAENKIKQGIEQAAQTVKQKLESS